MAYYILFAIIITFDFLSKLWVQENLPLIDFSEGIYPYGGIGIFSNLIGIKLSIVHAINFGAAWSLFSDYPNLLVYFRILLISVMIVYFLRGKIPVLYQFGFFLVLAGALGNVVDHFLYGHVIDMIKLDLWSYEYPVFNIADSSIFIGMLHMIVVNIKMSKNHG